MYARVPDELRPALLENLKRRRLKSAILYFPVYLLIFSVVVGAVIVIKGHYILELLEHFVGEKVSHAQFIAGISGAVLLITAIGLIYFIKQDFLECRCDSYFFCPDCRAVDNYDEGKCHVCGKTLSEKASFFYTTEKREIESIKRIGLPVFKESRNVSVNDEHA